MHITVDQNKCCSAGQCVLTADDLFDQDEDDGLVVLLESRPATAEAMERARVAARVCPASAIQVDA